MAYIDTSGLVNPPCHQASIPAKSNVPAKANPAKAKVSDSKEHVTHKTSLKQRIARQFSRAAAQYDSIATIQAQIGDHACQMLNGGYRNLLDIGCGTGRIQTQLASRCDALYGCDLALGMLHEAAKNSVQGQGYDKAQGYKALIGADAEHLPFQTGVMDGIYSSMALQWCSDQDALMRELCRVLAPNGSGILAVPTSGSLKQLASAWQQVDQSRHINQFAEAGLWLKAALEAALNASVTTHEYIAWFDDLASLLRSIKGVGANTLIEQNGARMNTAFSSANRPMTRQRLLQLENAYRHLYAQSGKLPLSYQISFISFYR